MDLGPSRLPRGGRGGGITGNWRNQRERPYPLPPTVSTRGVIFRILAVPGVLATESFTSSYRASQRPLSEPQPLGLRVVGKTALLDCSRISSGYCRLHQSLQCGNCPVVAARERGHIRLFRVRWRLAAQESFGACPGDQGAAEKQGPTSEEKQARELRGPASLIAFKQSCDREHSRGVLVGLWVGFSFICMLVGSGTGNAAEALMMGAAIGATWVVPFLIGYRGEGPATKELSKGDSCLQRRDYDAAIEAFSKVIELDSKALVSSHDDPIDCRTPATSTAMGGW